MLDYPRKRFLGLPPMEGEERKSQKREKKKLTLGAGSKKAQQTP